MIIGFLGKGGSGKSTLATGVAKLLHAQHKNVLAIDADYNMDLSHNLGAPEDMHFLGDDSRLQVKAFFNMPDNTLYRDVVLNADKEKRFTLEPLDVFSEKYIGMTTSGIKIMSVGPQTMSVLTDSMCSHGLGGALKVYLPLLKLHKDQAVVVDEKAGADSVGTGIPTGFNMSVIVVEPTIYGVKAAKQIAEILNHYRVPYVFVINKAKPDTDVVSIEKELGQSVVTVVPMGESVEEVNLLPIIRYTEEYIQKYGDLRYEQSVAKFNFNKEYNS